MQRLLMGKALPRFEALSVRFCTSDLRFNLDGVFSRAFCMYIIYLLFEIRLLFRDFHFSLLSGSLFRDNCKSPTFTCASPSCLLFYCMIKS